MLQTLKLMQQQMAEQQQIMAQLLQQYSQPAPQQQQPSPMTNNLEQIMDVLANNITEFRFEAESGVTFEAWYSRYEDLFANDASRLDDRAKTRLLVRKLGTAEHQRFTNFILPSLPRDLSFDNTVQKLKLLFGHAESLLSKRYKCLQIAKSGGEDILAYACKVNRACENFELAGMSESQFKCLIFSCGLKDEEDAEMRTKLLAEIDRRNDLTLEQLAAECQRIASLKRDSNMIALGSDEQVLAIRRGNQNIASRQYHQNPYHRSQNTLQKQPSYPCWLCGDLQWSRDCSYRTHQCQNCNRVGHREGYCKRPIHQENYRNFYRRPHVTNFVTVNSCSVRERRKYVHLTINGTVASLQLDTGSDITIINRLMWHRVGNPRLIQPEVRAKTATGESLPICGEFKANITIGKVTKQATIRVAEGEMLLL